MMPPRPPVPQASVFFMWQPHGAPSNAFLRQDVAMNNKVFAAILVAVAVFMYVSIIFKIGG